MRTRALALACLASSFALTQTVTSVYNRDTHEPFKLKAVQVESTVVGPIVRTSTWLTYENPFKPLTEATLNFELPDAAALSGFAYRYGDEYVRGQLMDKNKAWFIYTAITSRNRDPGIMEQWSPTSYHCQIFPLKPGQDLRVRLWTIGMVRPNGDKVALPKPQVPIAVGYEVKDGTIASPDWKVRSVKSGPVVKDGDDYVLDLKSPVTAVAQRFKDGRTYVAGLVKAHGAAPVIEILHASYEPQVGGPAGADVKEKVAAIVRSGETEIVAENRIFGDPTPNVFKQLHIAYRVNGGGTRVVDVPEHDRIDLADNDDDIGQPSIKGLRDPQLIRMEHGTYAFAGWLPRNRTLRATVAGRAMAFRPKPIPAGADAARLWAQRRLATGAWTRSKDVLAFSLKYGVPSNATALLAVPKEEMARYRAKEKEYRKAQAEARRNELEAQRKQRAWEKAHPQNWQSSGGGDPEIRVTVPDAVRVEAILPDRRVIALTPNRDVWGGNFEIPASVPEGVYRVRILAHRKDGTTYERSWTYDVDRTPPKGKASFDKGMLTVEAEPGLAEVAAYAPDGRHWTLREERPGLYRGEVPNRNLVIVLKDRAGNKGEATWSSR